VIPGHDELFKALLFVCVLRRSASPSPLRCIVGAVFRILRAGAKLGAHSQGAQFSDFSRPNKALFFNLLH